MKKSVLITAIVSMLLVIMLSGCRAVERVPGVSAVQSALPSLPGVSPSPAYTMTTPAASATVGGVTAGGVTAGASTTR